MNWADLKGGIDKMEVGVNSCTQHYFQALTCSDMSLRNVRRCELAEARSQPFWAKNVAPANLNLEKSRPTIVGAGWDTLYLSFGSAPNVAGRS